MGSTKMKKNALAIAVLIAVVLAGIAWKESDRSAAAPAMRFGPGATPVEVALVQPRLLEVRAEAVGTAYARESISVTSNVSDIVESVHFHDGQIVKRGDVLVILSKNEQEAELKAAQANLAEQEREVKRLQGLIQTRAVSQNQLDERITQRDTAVHRVAAAEARLRNRIIRAPFDGVLGLRQVSPGTLVTPGTVITTLDDTVMMKLDFGVPSIRLGSLQVGQQVEARSPAFPSRVFSGQVTSVDSRINEVDRSVTVRAELPNPEGIIKHGMLLHVDIVFSHREALLIPEGALVPIRDRQYVYVVSDEELPRAQMREVEIGERRPGLVEIVAGLEAGQMVVSRGTHVVRANGPLSIVGRADG